MTVNEFLVKNSALLKQHGIATARLDCLVLLADVMNTNSAHILAHPEEVISLMQQRTLASFIRRRIAYEPLAYIRNQCEFYGYTFYVSPDVLIPRPESEAFIDLLRSYGTSSYCTIIDIGTGSGALAITAKLTFPNLRIVGTDISRDCLDITRKNALKLGAKVRLFQGDLLKPFFGQLKAPTIIMANLPYVPNGFSIDIATRYEPSLALFGGHDGLDVYRQLFLQTSEIEEGKPLSLMTESLPSQHKTLTHTAHQYGFTLKRTDGLVQFFIRS